MLCIQLQAVFCKFSTEYTALKPTKTSYTNVLASSQVAMRCHSCFYETFIFHDGHLVNSHLFDASQWTFSKSSPLSVVSLWAFTKSPLFWCFTVSKSPLLQHFTVDINFSNCTWTTFSISLLLLHFRVDNSTVNTEVVENSMSTMKNILIQTASHSLKDSLPASHRSN